jgi:hypothetical protein
MRWTCFCIFSSFSPTLYLLTKEIDAALLAIDKYGDNMFALGYAIGTIKSIQQDIETLINLKNN